jgi:hypothetical protein
MLAHRVTVDLGRHGTYSAPAMLVDAMISRHLPASPNQLRAIVTESTDGMPIDWSDVSDVTAFLVVLAEWYEGELQNSYQAS